MLVETIYMSYICKLVFSIIFVNYTLHITQITNDFIKVNPQFSLDITNLCNNILEEFKSFYHQTIIDGNFTVTKALTEYIDLLNTRTQLDRLIAQEIAFKLLQLLKA